MKATLTWLASADNSNGKPTLYGYCDLPDGTRVTVFNSLVGGAYDITVETVANILGCENKDTAVKARCGQEMSIPVQLQVIEDIIGGTKQFKFDNRRQHDANAFRRG